MQYLYLRIQGEEHYKTLVQLVQDLHQLLQYKQRQQKRKRKSSTKSKTGSSKRHSATQSIVVPKKKVQRVEGSTHHLTFEEEVVVERDGATGIDTNDIREPCLVIKI